MVIFTQNFTKCFRDKTCSMHDKIHWVEIYKVVSLFTELRLSTLSKHMTLISRTLLNIFLLLLFFLLCSFLYSTHTLFFLFFIFLLLHIQRLKVASLGSYWITLTTNNFIPKNITSYIQFDLLNMERRELFIWTDYMTVVCFCRLWLS